MVVLKITSLAAARAVTGNKSCFSATKSEDLAKEASTKTASTLFLRIRFEGSGSFDSEPVFV